MNINQLIIHVFRILGIWVLICLNCNLKEQILSEKVDKSLPKLNNFKIMIPKKLNNNI